VKAGLCSPSPVRDLHDLGGNIAQRYDSSEDAELGAGARHAINGASGFVLAYGEAALAINRGHSFGTI